MTKNSNFWNVDFVSKSGRHKRQNYEKWQNTKNPLLSLLCFMPTPFKSKEMKCPQRILSQKVIFLREIPLCAILSMIDCKWQHYENKLLSHTLEVEMKAEVLLSTTRNAYHKKSWRSFLKCLSHWYALFPIGILGSESRHFFLMDYHTWLS